MAEKKKTQKNTSKNDEPSKECNDQFCPFHGSKPLKLRGRSFEGKVIKKLHGRLTIQNERTFYVPKYERYEKRKTKLHARLPDCLSDEIQVGDLVRITECRPVSKIIHFVVDKKIKSGSEEKK
jgi:small subunit ribosomal protein S17